MPALNSLISGNAARGRIMTPVMENVAGIIVPDSAGPRFCMKLPNPGPRR